MNNLIKKSASILADSPTFDKFISLLERPDEDNSTLLRVLTYHRVDEPSNRPHLDPGLVSATSRDFLQQMEYLSEYHHVLSIAELMEIKLAGRILPSNAVLVTFDDAYRDFQENAWPILKRLKLPVTLFVATDYPGEPDKMFWWDRLYHAVWNSEFADWLETSAGKYPLRMDQEKGQALRNLREYVKSIPHIEAMKFVDSIYDQLKPPPSENGVLDWEALRDLAQEGVTLGAHTQSHPLMNRISSSEAHHELIGSIEDLEREVGEVMPIFAYPGGGLNNRVVEILRQEDVQIGFTTLRGINQIGKVDWLQLRRINVGARTTLQILRAQLLPMAAHLNRLWSLSGA
jgi:peptidoglycan/xylan/chitin deacetylase (PgdA/CDA1 family)